MKGDESISRVISDYLTDPFSSSLPTDEDIEKATKFIRPKISDFNSISFDADFTEDDVKSAIFEVSY